ncbi:MAG: hypothetical protein BM564_11705 [Bacteroidetes bacterium MedPE-SWsnd-G2]|nr:MAG: hypothetical protein BM564_11705 [Bacteroidetes bacterium MedPE-SWsnd-G2]
MNRLMVIIAFFVGFTGVVRGQIGVGTNNPTAELEVETENAGLPALELNPQTNPVGTDAGQIAVIGDELYMYDASRSKWLSMATMPLQFGRNGATTAQNIHFGGNMVSALSGPLMPKDGTIIGITINSANGNATKEFEIRVRNDNSTLSTESVNLVDNVYNSISHNIDFSSGDYITVRARDNGNGDVIDPAIVVWVKWRG